jgi:hypothetical protein
MLVRNLDAGLWGGQDLNLRPTDYESAQGRLADLLTRAKGPLTCSFGARVLPVPSGRFECSCGFSADSSPTPITLPLGLGIGVAP